MEWNDILLLSGLTLNAVVLGNEITREKWKFYQAPLSIVVIIASFGFLVVGSPEKPCPATATPVTSLDATQP